MLKLNMLKKLQTLEIQYLNTSYVKVKPIVNMNAITKKRDLNTSYVKVKQKKN